MMLTLVAAALTVSGFLIETWLLRAKVPGYVRYGLHMYEAPQHGKRVRDKALALVPDGASFRWFTLDEKTLVFRWWFLLRGRVTLSSAEDATVDGYAPYSIMFPFLACTEQPWAVGGYTLALLVAVVLFYRRLDQLTYGKLER